MKYNICSLLYKFQSLLLSAFYTHTAGSSSFANVESTQWRKVDKVYTMPQKMVRLSNFHMSPIFTQSGRDTIPCHTFPQWMPLSTMFSSPLPPLKGCTPIGSEQVWTKMHLKCEQQQEGHHQTEQPHGLRQGKPQDGIGEKLLFQWWIPCITNDKGAEYCSNSSTWTCNTYCGSSCPNKLCCRVNVSRYCGGLEVSHCWKQANRWWRRCIL